VAWKRQGQHVVVALQGGQDQLPRSPRVHEAVNADERLARTAAMERGERDQDCCLDKGPISPTVSVMRDGRMHQTTVRFGPHLWEALETECARLGISAAQYLREAALARLSYTAGRRGDTEFEQALVAAGAAAVTEPDLDGWRAKT
jgi:hypothetical protein